MTMSEYMYLGYMIIALTVLGAALNIDYIRYTRYKEKPGPLTMWLVFAAVWPASLLIILGGLIGEFLVGKSNE